MTKKEIIKNCKDTINFKPRKEIEDLARLYAEIIFHIYPEHFESMLPSDYHTCMDFASITINAGYHK